MWGWRRVLLLPAVLLVAAAPAPTPAQQLLARVNALRAAGIVCPAVAPLPSGAPVTPTPETGAGARRPLTGTLTFSPLHAVAAFAQAKRMVQLSDVTHEGAGGSTPQIRAAAAGIRADSVSEIVYLGRRGGVEGAITWWRHSAVHCRVMTDPRYSVAGASVVAGPDGTAYVMVLTSVLHR